MMNETTGPAPDGDEDLVKRLEKAALMLVFAALSRIGTADRDAIEDALMNGHAQIRAILTMGLQGAAPPSPAVVVAIAEPGQAPLVEWAWGGPEDFMGLN